ncbi:hypothetical protein RZE82_09255 [Mollicutes bacterium LVI A0039]|nr:hypothetical protein RZE82_09255 [Mollicutes bacterium LVI A0039]
MNKVEELKQQLIEFNEQVGWGNLNPESALSLSSLLIGEAQELWEEINNESRIGINKYDVGLEIADIYIYLQKICIALDIDMLEAVEDKMLINRGRFLNNDYQAKVISPTPRANRFYKIKSLHSYIKVAGKPSVICGELSGIQNEQKTAQQVYVLNEDSVQQEYMKLIVGIVHPRDEQAPIWVAADQQLTVDEIDQCLKQVDYLYDIELIDQGA